MCEFTYVIKDEIGIHARPAGALVKIAKDSKSDVTMECKGKTADVKKIFALMSLGVKCGDEISISIKGEDEEETLYKLKEYLTKNL